ncbi:MAG: heavy-metal-associated domain-containing protein [Chloroflexi bacterium]|nr:heavy-metal-associated domain-containing protein [Chloroflexota bacterium]
MNSVRYSVPNMSCNHCVLRIQKALQTLDGVQKADVDLATKTVTIAFDPPASETLLKEILVEIGYPPA